MRPNSYKVAERAEDGDEYEVVEVSSLGFENPKIVKWVCESH